MKPSDRTPVEKKQKIDRLQKKKPKKPEKINWHELMGSNRDTFKRVKGAIRRK